MFSNDGPWVGYLRPGVALVSTFPRTYDASLNPTSELVDVDGNRRASLDLDDFTAGFGVWSGTSFAAPVFGAELAAALVDARLGGDTTGDTPGNTAAAVTRMRTLLADMPGRVTS